MSDSDVEIKILETLILYGEPMRAHWIAKKLRGGMDSLINYHLPRMVKKGLILEEVTADGKRIYKPQPIFMSVQHRNDFLDVLTKFVESKKNLIYVDPEIGDEQIINILRVLLSLIEEKLRLMD